ncbi:uncharacterized protein [Typha angustifolia]|uniref:uncharacterized protein n=1 Tax=Typha angustifolia TaxID=59011 RepID=UPI003C30EB1A
MVFISETKCDFDKSKAIISSLPLHNSHIVPSSGRAGGLWLLWHDDLLIEVIASNPSFIFAKIGDSYQDAGWTFGGIYGSPYHTGRDFNDIASPSEKDRGLPTNQSRLKEFISNINKVIDLRYAGPAYTWSNRRSNSNRVRQRLDRALARMDWCNRFPIAKVHLLTITSDHNPILLETDPARSHHCRKFCFENQGAKVDSFLPFCKEACNNLMPEGNISKQVATLTRKLRHWVSTHVGSITRKMKALEEEIMNLQSNACSDEDWFKEQTLPTARKRRNSVNFLRIDGHITHGQSRLTGREFRSSESFNRTSTNPPSIFSHALFHKFNQAGKPPDQHGKLCECPTMEEISSVIKDFALDCAAGPDDLNTRFFQLMWPELKTMVYNMVSRLFNQIQLE